MDTCAAPCESDEEMSDEEGHSGWADIFGTIGTECAAISKERSS